MYLCSWCFIYTYIYIYVYVYNWRGGGWYITVLHVCVCSHCSENPRRAPQHRERQAATPEASYGQETQPCRCPLPGESPVQVETSEHLQTPTTHAIERASMRPLWIARAEKVGAPARQMSQPRSQLGSSCCNKDPFKLKFVFLKQGVLANSRDAFPLHSLVLHIGGSTNNGHISTVIDANVGSVITSPK